MDPKRPLKAGAFVDKAEGQGLSPADAEADRRRCQRRFDPAAAAADFLLARALSQESGHVATVGGLDATGTGR